MSKEYKAHILYVEDDASLAFVIQDNLELEGYKVTYAKDGKEAFKEYKKNKFDLCLLDVMLPEVDGYSLAEQIRAKNTEVPIIFLTAKSMLEDRIHGLSIGGDDYIIKPFNMEELLLKLDIFLRRTQIQTPDEGEITDIGKFKLDYNNLMLRNGDEKQSLTQKEADLLYYLSENRNQLIKRGDVLVKLWGEDDYFLGRSMDVFITRLRKYLKPDPSINIENVRGIGFRFLVGEQ